MSHKESILMKGWRKALHVIHTAAFTTRFAFAFAFHTLHKKKKNSKSGKAYVLLDLTGKLLKTITKISFSGGKEITSALGQNPQLFT